MPDLPLAHFALSKSGWARYHETDRSTATKHCRDVTEDSRHAAVAPVLSAATQWTESELEILGIL